MAFLFILFLFALFSSSNQCPTGWNISTVVQNKCYLIVADKKDWFSARYYCQNSVTVTGAQLISICNAFENAYIGVLVANTPAITSNADQIWLGLNDIDNDGNGVFVWADESNGCKYTHWATGQPRLGIATECVSSMAKTTGYWSTKNCATPNYFICEYYVGSETNSSTSSVSTNSAHTTVYSSTTNPASSTQSVPVPDTNATDCYDIQLLDPFAADGVYAVHPPNAPGPFRVYCDMITDNGGWTVFQRRFDGSQDFVTQNWTNYETGFGDVSKEHWLGLEKLYWLIEKDAKTLVEMRVDLIDCKGRNFNETYESFKIGDAATKYVLLNATGSHGTAGDSFTDNPSQIGSKFSTRDQENDAEPFTSCALTLKGGWWYSGCGSAHLNSIYYPQCNYTSAYPDGIAWETAFPENIGFFYSPKMTKMMIRKIA